MTEFALHFLRKNIYYTCKSHLITLVENAVERKPNLITLLFTRLVAIR